MKFYTGVQLSANWKYYLIDALDPVSPDCFKQVDRIQSIISNYLPEIQAPSTSNKLLILKPVNHLYSYVNAKLQEEDFHQEPISYIHKDVYIYTPNKTVTSSKCITIKIVSSNINNFIFHFEVSK